MFGRLERVDKDELFEAGDPHARQTYEVGKVSLGAIHDFAKVNGVKLGVGALVSRYSVPRALDSVYGSNPTSYMLFLRAALR